MFLLRQAFLEKQAAIECWEQELRLAAVPSATDARLHAITAANAAQQMQVASRQQQEAFMQYIGVIMDGVTYSLPIICACSTAYPTVCLGHPHGTVFKAFLQYTEQCVDEDLHVSSCLYVGCVNIASRSSIIPRDCVHAEGLPSVSQSPQRPSRYRLCTTQQRQCLWYSGVRSTCIVLPEYRNQQRRHETATSVEFVQRSARCTQAPFGRAVQAQFWCSVAT